MTIYQEETNVQCIMANCKYHNKGVGCKIFKVFCMHECLSFKIDELTFQIAFYQKGEFAKLVLILVLVGKLQI